MSEQEAAPEPTKPKHDWSHIGAAIGAGLSIMGAVYASYQSGGASTSARDAIQAKDSIIVTSEMIERARGRAQRLEEQADRNAERISHLEKRILALEHETASMEKNREGTSPHTP